MKRQVFRPWYWAGVPLLAMLAYLTSLRVGFVADDFILLFEGQHGVSAQALLPSPPPAWTFYRPVGNLIVWILGWQLWGYNPLPYHVIGLLVHACAALVLGLWLAEATGKPWLGWLSGALFGVLPLHTEAVSWVSAQWDAWAVLFGLLSLWLFTAWWRRGARDVRLYVASLVCYALGVFTKESMLGWLPMLAVAAWFVTLRMGRRDWRNLGLFLLPFACVLALNLGLRWTAWHSIGGYPGARADFANFFWDGFIRYGRILLAPINTAVLGSAVQQVVGAVVSLLLVAGLIAYGRRQLRLLVLVACWLVLALVPVLNLSFNTTELNNSRFMYLAAAGYCVGVAALLYPALTLPGRVRRLSLSLVVVGFALAIAACWVQLRPWHTATVLAEDVGQELHRVLPTGQHPNGLVWYVENTPDTYQGAYVLIQGLDRLRYFLDGEFVQFKRADSAAQIDVANDPRGRDVFAMRYYFDPVENRYRLNYLSGFTADASPPSGAGRGQDFSLWDFRACDPAVVGKWRAVNTSPRCEHGSGLLFPEGRVDPQMVGPRLSLKSRESGARFVRLRVEASYPQGGTTGHSARWYYHGLNDSWGEQHSVGLAVRGDGQAHIYWTYLPVPDAGSITGLRFDPVDEQIGSSIGWIAVDLVK